MRWVDTKPPCVVCRRIHGRKGEETPCATCQEELRDEDYDVAKVFFAVRNHWITNGEKIIDLDIQAVKCAMDIYKIEDQKTCFERIKTLSRVLLKEM